jgi:hypothetical protein
MTGRHARGRRDLRGRLTHDFDESFEGRGKDVVDIEVLTASARGRPENRPPRTHLTRTEPMTTMVTWSSPALPPSRRPSANSSQA